MTHASTVAGRWAAQRSSSFGRVHGMVAVGFEITCLTTNTCWMRYPNHQGKAEMGANYRVNCDCGYEAYARTGATRATYLKSFWYPHACRQCLQVVSVDLACHEPKCPDCGSADLHSFGLELPRENCRKWGMFSKVLPLLGLGEPKGPFTEPHKFIDQTLNFHSGRTWGLPNGPHWCPACGEKSLRFELHALYD